MKKKKLKKLKKKIKKLKEACKLFMNQYGEELENQRRRMNTLTKTQNAFKEELDYLEQNRDANRFEINDIYEKLKILKLRTETDYTQFKPIVDTSKGPDTEESNGQ